MTIESNKALVRRYFDQAPYHPEVCKEIYPPRFVFHTIQHASVTAQDSESTPESEKEAYEWLRRVWSAGWRMTVDEMIAEGDRVMARWTFRGVHQGGYFGLPPTQKTVEYSGINIFRIEGGRIAEVWDICDRLWLWQQLGVLPDIRAAIETAKGGVAPKKAG